MLFFWMYLTLISGALGHNQQGSELCLLQTNLHAKFGSLQAPEASTSTSPPPPFVLDPSIKVLEEELRASQTPEASTSTTPPSPFVLAEISTTQAEAGFERIVDRLKAWRTLSDQELDEVIDELTAALLKVAKAKDGVDSSIDISRMFKSSVSEARNAMVPGTDVVNSDELENASQHEMLQPFHALAGEMHHWGSNVSNLGKSLELDRLLADAMRRISRVINGINDNRPHSTSAPDVALVQRRRQRILNLLEAEKLRPLSQRALTSRQNPDINSTTLQNIIPMFHADALDELRELSKGSSNTADLNAMLKAFVNRDDVSAHDDCTLVCSDSCCTVSLNGSDHKGSCMQACESFRTGFFRSEQDCRDACESTEEGCTFGDGYDTCFGDKCRDGFGQSCHVSVDECLKGCDGAWAPALQSADAATTDAVTTTALLEKEDACDAICEGSCCTNPYEGSDSTGSCTQACNAVRGGYFLTKQDCISACGEPSCLFGTVFTTCSTCTNSSGLTCNVSAEECVQGCIGAWGLFKTTSTVAQGQSTGTDYPAQRTTIAVSTTPIVATTTLLKVEECSSVCNSSCCTSPLLGADQTGSCLQACNASRMGFFESKSACIAACGTTSCTFGNVFDTCGTNSCTKSSGETCTVTAVECVKGCVGGWAPLEKTTTTLTMTTVSTLPLWEADGISRDPDPLPCSGIGPFLRDQRMCFEGTYANTIITLEFDEIDVLQGKGIVSINRSATMEPFHFHFDLSGQIIEAMEVNSIGVYLGVELEYGIYCHNEMQVHFPFSRPVGGALQLFASRCSEPSTSTASTSSVAAAGSSTTSVPGAITAPLQPGSSALSGSVTAPVPV